MPLKLFLAGKWSKGSTVLFEVVQDLLLKLFCKIYCLKGILVSIHKSLKISAEAYYTTLKNIGPFGINNDRARK